MIKRRTNTWNGGVRGMEEGEDEDSDDDDGSSTGSGGKSGYDIPPRKKAKGIDYM